MVKYFVPNPSPLHCPHPHPRLSVFCYNFCPPPHPHSLHSVLHIIFLQLIFCMLFFVLRQTYCNQKTSVQQSDHSSSAIYMFAGHRLLNFPLNVVTANRHYRHSGITASCLPSPRYYREIFPVPAVITVVTAVLLYHPLTCNSSSH